MKKFKEKHLEEIINKQFKISGNKYITYKRILKKQKIKGEYWYTYYKTTKEKENKWLKWLIEYLKPFCANKKILNKQVGRIYLNYGLKTYEPTKELQKGNGKSK